MAEDALRALKRLQVAIDPRYFWVALRGNGGTAAVDAFRNDLNFEVFDFGN